MITSRSRPSLSFRLLKCFQAAHLRATWLCRVKNAYGRFYPRSSAYQLCLASAVTTAAIAIGFVILRVYEYTHSTIPLSSLRLAVR